MLCDGDDVPRDRCGDPGGSLTESVGDRPEQFALLDLGADRQAVCQAVESVGCRLEVTRQKKRSIMACRAAVTSDRRFHSLDEARSILNSSCLREKALDNALRALHIDESLVPGHDRHELLLALLHEAPEHPVNCPPVPENARR